MKQNPDSYLLYECGKFITFNIRLKLVMRDEVDPAALHTAAQKAFKRFPYYAKEIRIEKAGGIDLIPNDRPLAVTPTKSGHPVLGGPEANYHLCSIFIAKNNMDAILYRYENNRNVLTMSKNIRNSASER